MGRHENYPQSNKRGKLVSPVEEYLAEQDFSASTKETYSRSIEAFFKFSKGKEPTAQLVRAWQKHLEQNGVGQSYLSRCMYALKGYCQWMNLDIFAGTGEKNRSK